MVLNDEGHHQIQQLGCSIFKMVCKRIETFMNG